MPKNMLNTMQETADKRKVQNVADYTSLRKILVNKFTKNIQKNTPCKLFLLKITYIMLKSNCFFNFFVIVVLFTGAKVVEMAFFRC